MVLSYYNAAAISTLDRLESESNRIWKNNPQLSLFDTHSAPTDIAVPEFSGIIYVAIQDSNTIYKINRDTLKVSVISVAAPPAEGYSTMDVDTSNMYITNSVSNTVSVVDRTNYTNIANITVGDVPVGIVVDDFRDIVYVVNMASSTVSVINSTNYESIANITVGNRPVSMAVDNSLEGFLDN